MKLKPLTLAEICPEDAEFTLASGKTYTIRKFTLADQAWVQKTFGGQNTLQHAFSDPENLLRIVFHQLEIGQQKEFAPVEVERVDEDTGELVVERVGGWRRFAASITNTAVDMQKIAEALTTAIVGSSALLDEEAEIAVAGEEKKKQPRGLGGDLRPHRERVRLQLRSYPRDDAERDPDRSPVHRLQAERAKQVRGRASRGGAQGRKEG